jgi:hypothetical protein
MGHELVQHVKFCQLFENLDEASAKIHQLSLSTSPFNGVRSCARYSPVRKQQPEYRPRHSRRLPGAMMIANCNRSKQSLGLPRLVSDRNVIVYRRSN